MHHQHSGLYLSYFSIIFSFFFEIESQVAQIGLKTYDIVSRPAKGIVRFCLNNIKGLHVTTQTTDA